MVATNIKLLHKAHNLNKEVHRFESRICATKWLLGRSLSCIKFYKLHKHEGYVRKP